MKILRQIVHKIAISESRAKCIESLLQLQVLHVYKEDSSKTISLKV